MFKGGEISWHLINCVYERDSNLQANLRKTPKLTYETLHPGNKKQNVQLAFNIFHETTTAAISSYFRDSHRIYSIDQHWVVYFKFKIQV